MKKLIIFFAVLLMPMGVAQGHSGRTDANGGHNCNVGACAGTYHYHNGGSSYTPPREPEYTPPPPSSSPPKPKPKAVKNMELVKSKTENKDENADCFIATAAYGTPFVSDIETLREFRDKVLTKSLKGQLLVFAYNHVGPIGAEFIEDKPALRTAIRESVLKPIVWFLDLSKIVWK